MNLQDEIEDLENRFEAALEKCKETLAAYHAANDISVELSLELNSKLRQLQAEEENGKDS